MRQGKEGAGCANGSAAPEDRQRTRFEGSSFRKLFSGRCGAAASGPHLEASAAGTCAHRHRAAPRAARPGSARPSASR